MILKNIKVFLLKLNKVLNVSGQFKVTINSFVNFMNITHCYGIPVTLLFHLV